NWFVLRSKTITSLAVSSICRPSAIIGQSPICAREDIGSELRSRKVSLFSRHCRRVRRPWSLSPRGLPVLSCRDEPELDAPAHLLTATTDAGIGTDTDTGKNSCRSRTGQHFPRTHSSRRSRPH